MNVILRVAVAAFVCQWWWGAACIIIINYYSI